MLAAIMSAAEGIILIIACQDRAVLTNRKIDGYFVRIFLILFVFLQSAGVITVALCCVLCCNEELRLQEWEPGVDILHNSSLLSRK